MSKSLILILFLTLSLELLAQHRGNFDPSNMPKDGILKGKVIDAENSEGVEYASISVFKHRDSTLVNGVISGLDGGFELKEMPYGFFYVEINFIGYEKKNIEKIKITPKSKTVDLGQINLEKTVTHLGEVDVVADKLQVEYKIDKKVVNVSQDVVSQGATAVEVLENVPSIQTDMDGNVSIRGSSNFTVLIDGRPSILEGNEALKQLPASAIENIEIITSPSAKYDPDGLAGIINVVLKKQKFSGISGLLNVTTGTGPEYATNGTINYRTNKFSSFIGFDYSDRNRPGSQSAFTEYKNDTLDYQKFDADRNRFHNGYSIKGGMEFFINDFNTLSISGSYGKREFGSTAKSNYHEYSLPPGDIIPINNIYSHKRSDFKLNREYYNLNLNYQLKFDDKGHELSSYIDFSNSDGGDEDRLMEYCTDEKFAKNSYALYNQTLSGEDEEDQHIRFQIDYIKPIGEEGKLESGYQTRIDNGTSDFSYKDYDPDTKAYNNIDYLCTGTTSYRNIQSVYATFSNKMAGINFMLGLRGEYSHRITKYTKLEEEKKYDAVWVNIFPTLHLSRQLPNKQQIQASYSRRINRPRGHSLEPFPSYRDPKNVRVGNPRLEPEFTDSYELNYQKRINKGFIAVEAYYRQTNDMIARVERTPTIEDIDEYALIVVENMKLHTYENIDKERSAGLELMGNLDFYHWWNLNLSGTFYRYRISDERLDEEINKSTNTWNARLSSTFKLRWGTRIQLRGYYRGSSITAQGNRKGFLMSDLGVKQDIKNFSLSMQVRDIFQTGKFSFTNYGDDFTTDMTFRRQSPTFSVTLTYRINNYKEKRDRNGGMEENGGMEGGDEF